MFYLGTDRLGWLSSAGVPLFVSQRGLAKRKKLPRALAPWALDSGGFTELTLYGRWETTVAGYVAATRRYAEEIGSLDFAAPMDWMCEPAIREATGLSVTEHQRRTVENFLELRESGLPFIPVLQGWDIADYTACAEMYADAGVDLVAERVVGLGTVCRRQSTREGEDVVVSLAHMGLRLHGFGVKVSGLRRYGYLLRSADSMAWSYAGRMQKREAAREGRSLRCVHGRSAAHCLGCAITWRDRVIEPRYQQTHLGASS